MTIVHCWFCGAEVTTSDYDYVGYRKVYVCGSRECDRETRDAQRGVEEEAQIRANDDNYERYW